jgi:S1-C subfamily serine protease
MAGMSYYEQPPPQRFSPWLPLTLLVVLLGLLWWRFGPELGREGPLHDPSARPRPVTPRGELLTDEQDTINVFERSWPGVVFVTPLNMRINRYTGAVSAVPSGTGSGFVWDQNGNIVTNFHVIKNADAAQVLLPGVDRPYRARLVGHDPDHDLAVLKIDAPADQLRPLPIGTSADLKVGQKVLAIGNPFGLNGTLTTGVISALNRAIETDSGRTVRGVIQTDAAINPGNSGGPLLDSAGRVIGVNTAIYSRSGDSAGIGFAIPVDAVNRIVPQLIAGARPDPPRLGVILYGRDEARLRGIDNGLLVQDVIPGSGAAQAGVRAGDVILALNGRPVGTPDELRQALGNLKVGQSVTVTVARGGALQEIAVTLQAL